MPTKVAQIERFSGLDLRQDPGEHPGAVDLTNIVFQPGRIKSRPGVDVLLEAFRKIVFLFAQESTLGSYVIAVTDDAVGTTYVLDPEGAEIAGGETTFGAAANQATSAVAIGTPTATYVYLQVGGVIKRWDGAVWTTPGTFPANPKGVITYSPTDNRLIVTTLQAGGNYRTHFSDPGAPETFGANNYVDLRPGDGEVIRAAAVFDNQTFLFKRSKFFVFYGNSTDSVGNPVFNYRTVQGSGVAPAHAQAATVGRDGVYYLGVDGIYRTTGGPGRMVSSPIRPFFTGKGQPEYWSGGTWDLSRSAQSLHWHDGVLYASLSTQAAGTTLFTYDPDLDAWSRWDLPAFAFASLLDSGAKIRLIIGGELYVLRLNDDAHADDGGSFILATYRSGYMDFGSASKKTIRETMVEGSGTVNFAWGTDYTVPLAADQVAVTLGAHPNKAVGRYMRAVQGQRFSYLIECLDGVGFEINSMQVNVIAERPAHVT